MNHAGDAPLQLRAHGNHKAVAANGDQLILRCALRGELAQRGAQAFFNQPLLALLIAADAAQLGRSVVGQRAVGLNRALDRLGQRTQAGGECRRQARKPHQLAHQPRRGRLQQRLPGGHVVGQPRHGLQFVRLQRCAGNLRLGGVLRGVEESAYRNGSLLSQQQTQLFGELMLASNPDFVGRGLQVENRLPAHRRSGKAGHQRQQRLPLQSGKVGVQHRRRNGIKKGHCQKLS